MLAGALPLLLLGPMAVGYGQESAPETGEVRNGTAKATALVSRIGPGVGRLELAMRGGVAVTQVTNSLAQSTAQTLDLGLIGSSLTAESCDGSQALRPDDLPQPTSVDNRGGDARLSESDSETEGQPFGLGNKVAEATRDPISATAVVTSNGIDLAPAMRLGSGRSRAVTKVLPGEGREARAQVQSSIDIGGVLTMSGMHWDAYHRTGVEPHAEATFDVGRAEVGGLPFPGDDLGALEDAANAALEALGVSIAFPRVERFLEPTDLIRMTPMRIEIRDSPAGRTIFGPVLDASREQRGDLFDALVAQLCHTASVLLVGDVVLSIVTGTGFLTLEIGGAEATSSDLEVKDPFGAPVPPPGAGAVPPVAGGGAGPAGPGPPPAPPTDTVVETGDAERAAAATSRSGPLEEFCESVHPNGGGCDEGAALALGLIALAGTVGLAGTDLVRQRRSQASEVES